MLYSSTKGGGEMRADTYYMLTFDTAHAAMSAERRLSAFLPVCVMPTLRAVSASCGISLRAEQSDFEALQRALQDVPMPPYRLYRVTPDGPALHQRGGRETE